MRFHDLDIIHTIRRYRLRYVLALSLIACLTIAAFVANRFMIDNQRSDGTRINIAGRQRMLSQRTALFAARLALTREPEDRLETRAQLTQLIDLFERSHEALLEGDATMKIPARELDERALSLYFGDGKLDEKMALYIEDLRTLATSEPGSERFDDAFERNKQQAPALLVSLDQATQLYENQSRENTDQLALLETAIVIMMLFTLMCEALLVFRPMDRQLAELLDRIKREGLLLEEAMAQLELVLEASGDAIVTILPDGTLGAMHSQCFEQWFGSCEEGEDVIDVIFGHEPLICRRVREAFAGLSKEEAPLVSSTLPGVLPSTLARDSRHYSLHWRVLEGDAPRVVLIARDISTVHAALEARETSRAKSIFLANIAHEFRTPLTAIMGYTELIQEEYPEEELLNEDLDSILLAASQLLQLVNEILDLSKVEAGQMEVHPTSFEIDRLTEEVARVLRPNLNAQKNTLHIEVDEKLELLFSDRDKLRQIMVNLLSNANKFTHGGEIYLRAKTTLIESSMMLLLEVEDTGEGMDEETQDEIFDGFSQGLNAVANRHKGTGLGLSITRQFSKLLGGDITLESEVGVGTTFRVTLPITWTLEQASDVSEVDDVEAQIASLRAIRSPMDMN